MSSKKLSEKAKHTIRGLGKPPTEEETQKRFDEFKKAKVEESYQITDSEHASLAKFAMREVGAAVKPNVVDYLNMVGVIVKAALHKVSKGETLSVDIGDIAQPEPKDEDENPLMCGAIEHGARRSCVRDAGHKGNHRGQDGYGWPRVKAFCGNKMPDNPESCSRDKGHTGMHCAPNGKAWFLY